MKAKAPPAFSANVPGPWGVDSIGSHWYVVHRASLRVKKIGVVGSRRTNYFDRAIEEADRRNRGSAEDICTRLPKAPPAQPPENDGLPKPPPGYTAEELERDSPYNQWLYGA